MSSNRTATSEPPLTADEIEEQQRRFFIERNYGGPHGLGDPYDRSLRHVEAEKYIPHLMREEVKHKCPTEFRCELLFDVRLNSTPSAFGDCIKRVGEGTFWYKCRPERDVLYACYERWIQNPQFAEEITDRYLEDRALYRATGESAKQRRTTAFNLWKKQNTDESLAKS